MRNFLLGLFIFVTIIVLTGVYIKSRFPATIDSSDLCPSRETERSVPVNTYGFGPFTLRTGEVFTVYKSGSPDRPLLKFEPEEFIAGARASRSVDSNAGSFSLSQDVREKYTIEAWQLTPKETGLEISGNLRHRGNSIGFTFEMKAISGNQLEFGIETNGNGAEITNLAFRFKSPPEERIFGFGEQYNHLNLQGKAVPIWVQEQGIARGKTPDSILVNLVSRYSSGAWHTTYAPVPYFITDRPRALVLENTEFSLFDFQDGEEAEIQVWAAEMSGRIFTGETPRDVLEGYSSFAGRMDPLPDWVNEGAIVHIQGGSDRVRGVAKGLIEAGVPLSALWIEDWAGTREEPGPRLNWNWEVDRELYPDWEQLISDLQEKGIRVLIYFNPCLIENGDKSKGGKNLYETAAEKGYFVQNSSGEVYPLNIEGPASAGMLDLTNGQAREWFKEIMKEQLGLGVAGWMADYGEYLPSDAVLDSGIDPTSYHNRYPVEWARLNGEAMQEAGKEEEALYFSRSGFTGSPATTRLFWTGDQNIGWDRYDGLKTVVPALLSSGLSGFSLNHPDIGGYRSFSIPLFTYHRSEELVKRWIELATFTAAFRWHSGSEPEKNIQVYNDKNISKFFARFARIYKALAPYRSKLMEEASEKGTPLIRHLMLHYPDDPEVYGLKQEFMLGPDFLIRPIVSQGKEKVLVYFPGGEWIHLWSGDKYGKRRQGVWREVKAPIGEPAVFYRVNSEAGRRLAKKLERLDI